MATTDASQDLEAKSSNSRSNKAKPPPPPVQAQSLEDHLHNFGGWAEANWKPIVVVCGVLLLAGIAKVSFAKMREHQEHLAQDAYYSVESKYTKLKEGYDQAKFQGFMPKDKPNAVPSKPATGDLEKDYGTVLHDLDRVARERVGTAAGTQAALLAGETYLTYKQPDKAIELAQLGTSHTAEDSILHMLTLVMWGNALAAKDDCQGAVSTWAKVIDSPSALFLQGDVSLRAGLCYEQLGQNDRASEMYRKASQSGETSAAQSAKGFLRALEVKMAKAAPPTKQG